jgi:hypothetical protein
MEDDLNILENGRRPQFESEWKTTPVKAGLALASPELGTTQLQLVLLFYHISIISNFIMFQTSFIVWPEDDREGALRRKRETKRIINK